MRAPTRMPTPQAPRRRRNQKGWKEHGPSLRSAWRARRAAPAPLGAERSDGPWGSWAAALPSGCAEERSGQRIRARDCLSAAGASSSETPLAASTAGCPQRSGGTHPAGSPFLCLLSFGEAKESESPAGARPGLCPRKIHNLRYEKHSYQRLPYKRQRPKTPQIFTSTSPSRRAAPERTSSSISPSSHSAWPRSPKCRWCIVPK